MALAGARINKFYFVAAVLFAGYLFSKKLHREVPVFA